MMRDKFKISRVFIACMCAAVLLVALTCVYFFFAEDTFADTNSASSKESSYAAYLEYMGRYVIIDSQGVVCSVEKKAPNNTPKVTGLSINSMVIGKDIVCSDEGDLDYVLNIIHFLRQNGMDVDEVYISSDKDATIYINDLKILLGDDENTENKLNDLRLFYDSVETLAGTLYMQEYSGSDVGYSFRYSS